MGYTGDISLLSKFSKFFLPPIWNGLFNLLFERLSERVSGSDSASNNFYTLIYGLYYGINLDIGSVIWAQFIHSTTSSTRHKMMSYACFWSIVVKRTLIHYKVPQMLDSLMAEILSLQTTTFIMLDPKNFEFVGSISDALLEKISLGNAIIKAYRKLPSFGVRPMHVELKRSLIKVTNQNLKEKGRPRLLLLKE